VHKDNTVNSSIVLAILVTMMAVLGYILTNIIHQKTIYLDKYAEDKDPMDS